MKTLIAPTMQDCVYAGPTGNVSKAMGEMVLKHVPPETNIELLSLPIGLKLLGARMVTDGLGTNVSVDLWVGDQVLAVDVEVEKEGVFEAHFMPIYLTQPATLTAKIKGGTASGHLLVVPEYLSVGF
ncbi:TPA: hypothetical protein ACX6QU_003393 [Photobacterium damselae]